MIQSSAASLQIHAAYRPCVKGKGSTPAQKLDLDCLNLQVGGRTI